MYYSLYTQKLAKFMKVWGVASEDVGSRELPSSPHGRVHGGPR